jgi:multidrug transporter EmrE-like cation transporter
MFYKMEHAPIIYGTAMAGIDVLSFGLLKAIHLQWISPYFFAIPVFIYACQPILFLKSLNYEGMAVMNLIWDLLSGVLVSILGLYLFQEKITRKKLIGIILSIVAIYLLAS